MSDEEIRELERAWRADPRDDTWLAMARAHARSGRPFALELRLSGIRLSSLRPRLEYRSAARDRPGDGEKRRAMQVIALAFATRQARRAARALRRAVEAGLDPRGFSWHGPNQVEVPIYRPGQAYPKRPERTVEVPKWVREVGRNAWFLLRANRRRPRTEEYCRCGHEGFDHRGTVDRAAAPGDVEFGPRACTFPCACKVFRHVDRDAEGTARAPDDRQVDELLDDLRT